MVQEAIHNLESNPQKPLTYTIEANKDIYKAKEKPISYKFEVTFWTLQWRDQDVIGLMFNNDCHTNRTNLDRFQSSY